jgi:heme exporter protein B
LSGPGFVRAAIEVAAKDLRLEWRTLESLSAAFVFSLIVLVLFSFAFGVSASREIGVERVVPGAVWTVLAFATVVTVARSMDIERRGDTMGALFLAPVDRGALFTGKAAANLVKNGLLHGVVIVLAALFFDFDLGAAVVPLGLVLVAHTVGLTTLGTLFGAIATRVGRGEALVATLLFPASAPVFVSAVKCTASVLAGRGLGGEARTWLLVTVGLDVLYFLVALATFEFVLEE